MPIADRTFPIGPSKDWTRPLADVHVRRTSALKTREADVQLHPTPLVSGAPRTRTSEGVRPMKRLTIKRALRHRFKCARSLPHLRLVVHFCLTNSSVAALTLTAIELRQGTVNSNKENIAVG
jgi:hypothetical protein